MKKLVVTSLLLTGLSSSLLAAPVFETGEYRNLFVEMGIATYGD